MCGFGDNNNKQMPNYWNILYPCTRDWNELGASESLCGNKSMAPNWIRNASVKTLFILKSLCNTSWSNNSNTKHAITSISWSHVWLNAWEPTSQGDAMSISQLCKAVKVTKTGYVYKARSKRI